MTQNNFKFDFTAAMAQELLTGNNNWQNWYFSMQEILPLWGVDTINRVAGFIAQCAHESNNFRALEENLNYSADALDKVFPKYFSRAGRNAQDYHRQPERIANIIYANRMDNGSPESGDGWRYRGRGIIQLTGKYNYTQFAKSVGISLEDAIDYIQTEKGALDSACWFWDTNNLNSFADAQDIVGMSKRINGGTIGLEHRTELYHHALDVFGGNYNPSQHVSYETVRRGSRGPTVSAIQQSLGLVSDGIFGPGTEAAVKQWQASNGLVVDGIAGPNTIRKLLG